MVLGSATTLEQAYAYCAVAPAQIHMYSSVVPYLYTPGAHFYQVLEFVSDVGDDWRCVVDVTGDTNGGSASLYCQGFVSGSWVTSSAISAEAGDTIEYFIEQNANLGADGFEAKMEISRASVCCPKPSTSLLVAQSGWLPTTGTVYWKTMETGITSCGQYPIPYGTNLAASVAISLSLQPLDSSTLIRPSWTSEVDYAICGGESVSTEIDQYNMSYLFLYWPSGKVVQTYTHLQSGVGTGHGTTRGFKRVVTKTPKGVTVKTPIIGPPVRTRGPIKAPPVVSPPQPPEPAILPVNTVILSSNDSVGTTDTNLPSETVDESDGTNSVAVSQGVESYDTSTPWQKQSAKTRKDLVL